MSSPKCMDHPGSRVVKAGLYGPPERRRQLWWCYPDQDRGHPDRHRFAEELPRTLLEAGESFCADCTTHLAVHEGPIHARAYEHSARTIAAALVAVGHGVSYELAARTARNAAGYTRVRVNGPTARHGANGTMVADWVGVYSPVVTRPLRRVGPEPGAGLVAWPEVVAFDDLPFQGRRQRGRKKQPAAWGVLAAYAYPETVDPVTGNALQPRYGKSSGYLFALGATPVLSADQAKRFLLSYPGRPKYVIADGSGVWAKAFADAWPEVVDPATGVVLEEAPTVLPCLWHLGGVVRSWLRASSILPTRDETAQAPPARRQTGLRKTGVRSRAGGPRLESVPPDATYWNGQVKPEDTHPLVIAGTRALNSVEDWDRFVELAYKWQAKPLIDRLGDGSDIRDILDAWPLGVARSIGGLEGVLRQVKFDLRLRARSLKNVRRTQMMLDLMVMHRRGLGDERAYTRALHAALTQRHGRAPRIKVGVTGGPHLH